MIPSHTATGMVQLRVDWVIPNWSVSSHWKVSGARNSTVVNISVWVRLTHGYFLY